MADKFRIKFIAHPETISAIEDLPEHYPDEFSPEDIDVIARPPVNDPVRLGFDLQTVAAILTVITSTCYFGELALRLHGLARKAKILVQTPTATIEIKVTGDTTVGDVRKLLQKALEPPK